MLSFLSFVFLLPMLARVRDGAWQIGEVYALKEDRVGFGVNQLIRCVRVLVCT